LGLYRMATILEYQEDGGEVKQFDLSNVRFRSRPIDPAMFLVAK
jgi:hypothetical protein